jgi:hypothetical protein
MTNWLVNRLTQVKKDTPRWSQLATSIQELWEGGFDPEADRMQRIKSIYTADVVDLQRKIGELGDFFSDIPRSSEDQAIAIAWRKLELLLKDREDLITSTFSRKFRGLPVSWIPLWAKKTDSYGTAFFAEDEIDDFSEYYLTSRGKLAVNVADITARRINVTDFQSYAASRMLSIKPLHIVFDGLRYFRTKLLSVDFGFGQFMSTHIEIGLSVISVPILYSPMYFAGGVRMGTHVTIQEG